MLVVHAVWRPTAGLALWAEDPSVPLSRSRSRRAAQPHPFAAAGEELTAVLGDLAAKAVGGSLTLDLPTRDGRPVDSPELVRDELAPAGRGTLTLAPWQVPAVCFDPDGALDLLGAVGSGSDPQECALGASVRHLVSVAEFALDLVGRGRTLPTVVESTEGPSACWRPLLTGPDAAWAQALAIAMPPATRAVAGAPDSAGEITADAVDALVDAAARAALPNVTHIHQRTPGGEDAWRAWLGALTGRQRRFSAEPAAVRRLTDDLTAWQRDAMAGPGPGLLPPDRAARGRGRRRGVRGLAAGVRPAGGRRAEPGRRRDQGLGGPWVAAGAGPAPRRSTGDAPGRARAGPAGSSPSWTTRCAPPDRSPSISTASGAHRFLRDGAPLLARGRVRGAAARRGGAGRGPGSGARLQAPAPAPRRVRWPPRSALGLDSSWTTSGSSPSATSRSPRPSCATLAELQDAAGPAARPVGRARRQAARRRAEAAHQRRPDDRGRPAARRTVRTGRVRPGCRWSAVVPTARSATCWPARSSAGSPRVTSPAGLPGHAAAVPGARPGLAGVPAVARPRRRPRRRHGAGQDGAAVLALLARDERRGRRADAAGLSDVAGRQLAAGGGQVRARAAGARAPRGRAGPRRDVRRGGGRTPTWSSPRTRWRPATPTRWPRSTGTGWSWTRRRRSRTRPPGRRSRSAPCRPGTGSRSPGRRWRTGWPTCGRSWSSPIPACSARALGVQEAIREPIERHGDDDGGRAAAPDHRPVRAAPRQDRQVDHLRPAGQARDGGAVQPHRRAGAPLPGRRRRHDGQDRAERRASSGAGWCWPR